MIGVIEDILWLLVLIGVMINIHELGHFWAARFFDVKVEAFSFGFGTRLFGFRRGETDYRFSLLPIGGYVNMAGEDADSPGVPPERTFRGKSVGWRLAIVLAGPTMNFVLAIILLAAIAVSYGVPLRVSTQVGEVEPGYPAAQAGLQAGDTIISVDGRLMRDGQQMVDLIHRSGDRTLAILVQRGSRRFILHVPTRFDPKQKVWITGFKPTVVRGRLDPFRAVGWGAATTYRDAVAYLAALGNLIQSGRLLGELGGPVTAVNVLGQAAHAGGETFLYFTAFFSIIIGLFNLFPLPALDGGRAAFLIIEGLRRRPVDPRREGYIHLVGLALLLCLILALTVRDVLHPVHLTLP